MTCYLVTEFKEGECPEVLNIFKTFGEAEDFMHSFPTRNLMIELGDDGWLKLLG